MFILSIFLVGREAALFLNFKYRPAATTAVQGGKGERFYALDDFGHEVDLDREAIAGTMVTDLEAEHALHGDMAMLQAKAQLKAQQKMQADPALKFAAGLMNGQMGHKPPFSM